MSQTQITTVVVGQPQSNGLGVAGFIVSLVGFVTCGLLSPIGLLLSFLALFKAPRGMAFAGTILGALGSIWLPLFGLAIVGGALGISKARELAATAIALVDAESLTREMRDELGRWPTADEFAQSVATRADGPIEDGWGNPIALITDDDVHELRSSGPDGEPDTADDITRSVESETAP